MPMIENYRDVLIDAEIDLHLLRDRVKSLESVVHYVKRRIAELSPDPPNTEKHEERANDPSPAAP